MSNVDSVRRKWCDRGFLMEPFKMDAFQCCSQCRLIPVNAWEREHLHSLLCLFCFWCPCPSCLFALSGCRETESQYWPSHAWEFLSVGCKLPSWIRGAFGRKMINRLTASMVQATIQGSFWTQPISGLEDYSHASYRHISDRKCRGMIHSGRADEVKLVQSIV